MNIRRLIVDTGGFLVVLTLAAFVPLALSAVVGP
jgi:hypothetical protein